MAEDKAIQDMMQSRKARKHDNSRGVVLSNQEAGFLERTMIYEDPFTRTKPEGVARIMSFVTHNPRDKSMDCMVKFDGERERVRRTIYLG